MATRGIFQKTCPSCAIQVPADELRCGCGFSFRNDAAEESSGGDQAEQELMYEYLKARMVQAVETLESLHSELVADPKNFEKANRLMKAYADVRSLRTELKEMSPPPVETDIISAATKALAQVSMATEPPQAFRTAQAQKAEKIMQAVGMKTKECGKCRAVLPERAMLCFCGYAFADVGADAASTDAAEPGLSTPA